MTTALGFDLEWGGFRPGLHVIADVAFGDNVPLARGVTSRPPERREREQRGLEHCDV